jgi:hypothetical protein
MSLEVQFKIRSNPLYVKYLRENSKWYKILNRDPLMISVFEEKVREDYKLRFSDRLTKTLSTIEMFQNIFSSLK